MKAPEKLRSWDGKWYWILKWIPNPTPGALVAGWVIVGEEVV